MYDVNELIKAGWTSPQTRPEDGALVGYVFAPSMTLHSGIYDKKHDSVCGASGFTTWVPEILCWFAFPAALIRRE